MRRFAADSPPPRRRGFRKIRLPILDAAWQTRAQRRNRPASAALAECSSMVSEHQDQKKIRI